MLIIFPQAEVRTSTHFCFFVINFSIFTNIAYFINDLLTLILIV